MYDFVTVQFVSTVNGNWDGVKVECNNHILVRPGWKANLYVYVVMVCLTAPQFQSNLAKQKYR